MDTITTIDVRHLAEGLETARAAMDQVLGTLTGDEVVYREGTWTTRDVIAHLAAWEADAASSVEATNAGGSYWIRNLQSEDDYNDQARRQWGDSAFIEVRDAWSTARTRLAVAIRAASDLNGALVMPWGSQGTVAELGQDMIGHANGHLEHILRASRR